MSDVGTAFYKEAENRDRVRNVGEDDTSNNHATEDLVVYYKYSNLLRL